MLSFTSRPTFIMYICMYTHTFIHIYIVNIHLFKLTLSPSSLLDRRSIVWKPSSIPSQALLTQPPTSGDILICKRGKYIQFTFSTNQLIISVNDFMRDGYRFKSWSNEFREHSGVNSRVHYLLSLLYLAFVYLCLLKTYSTSHLFSLYFQKYSYQLIFI